MPEYLVEQLINSMLDSAIAEAKALLLGKFAWAKLADLSAGFTRRFAAIQIARERSG